MKVNKPLRFALPGAERQDSVESGLKSIRPDAALVAVHDSARPMMRAEDVRACIQDAEKHGAAVLGVPVKPTIKEVSVDLGVGVSVDLGVGVDLFVGVSVDLGVSVSDWV